MSAYQKHERASNRLDLVELNKVLRTVGFAKFHGKLRAELPRPPKVPKQQPATKLAQRGAPEAGSAKASLQAAIKNSRSAEDVPSQAPLMPPQPPTAHIAPSSSSSSSSRSSLRQAESTESSAARLERLFLQKQQQQQQQQPQPPQQQQQQQPPRANPRPKAREGTEDSYHVDYNSDIRIDPLAAHRCYRILTYKDTSEGRIVMDILSGQEYYCRSGPQKRRITSNVPVFASRSDALCEKFPASEGRAQMPRILVRFDAWGRCRKRYGGGGSSAVYEYVKFVGVIKSMDGPSTISKKQVEHPIFPHNYPMADKPLKLRSPIDRRILVDKSFDVHPWFKGQSIRAN